MKKSSLKMMTLVLSLLFLVLTFPKDTLAESTPSAPTNLTAIAESSSEIYLKWDSVRNATSYYVYSASSSSGTYERIATTAATQFRNVGLSEDTTYYYKVRAVNSAGTSSYSSIAYETTDDSDESTTLEAPEDLTATAESSSEIYLDWDSVSDATSYYVYRSTSSSGTYTKIDTTTSSRYTDEDLESDTKYYYKVKAVNKYNTSSYSSKEYATTLESDGSDESDESTTLEAPEDLTATAESSSEIYLDWDSVSDASSYYVYRSTSSSGTYSRIDTTTSSRFTDEDLESDTKYYYKVKAVDSSGTSPYSSREYATTLESDGSDDSDESDTLEAPEDLTATAESSSEIYLDWDSVSDASSYYVYRSTSSSGTYTKIDTTTSSRYTDVDLESETKYYYKVKAVDKSGTSPYSSREYATTLEYDESDDTGKLKAPTNLSAKVESATKIYLDWESVSAAKSYDIFSATSSSGSYYKIATSTSSSYTDTNLESDTTYYYKIKAVNGSDTSAYSNKTYATTSDSDHTAPSEPSPQIQYERLAGQDMYDTSAEVAKKWTTSYYAIVVNGDNFSDALCGAPLAQKYNAPLLLTKSNVLSAQTQIQLERLKVKKVIIVGGTGIISSEVEKSIKFMGIGVSRISGTDRYDTAIKIAQSLGDFDQAVIASGETFPDALSIAPIAAMKGIPIFLTTKDNLPENVKTFLLKNVQSTYVVGGTGVISDNVLMQLPSPKRLSGITRYDTNISIIKEFADELNFGISYVSTGETYADALAGSALASLTNSPVILVSDPVEPSTLAFFRSKNRSIQQKVVFGGTFVVPERILTSINEITEASDTPSAPTGLKATTVSSSQINLTWDSVSDATSYYVYGATSGSGTYTHIDTVNTTIYVNTRLWADTTYYYKVKAVNDAGSSSYSAMDYAKTTLTDN